MSDDELQPTDDKESTNQEGALDVVQDDELEIVNDEENSSPESVLVILRDVGERLPSYAKLSVNLVSAGKMSGAQQSQILGPLGYGAASRFTRFVPLLNQISRVLSMIGTIRFVLTQMDVETANTYLESVGLSREQVEQDFRMTRDLAKRAGETGTREAGRALEIGTREASRALDIGTREAGRAFENGARIAGRLTGKGIRSFRNWQARSTDQSDQS